MTQPSLLHPVIENLLVAQRALTRATIQGDAPTREIALAARDRAYKAVDEAFNAIDAALMVAQRELLRSRNQVQNLGALVAELRQKDPLFVQSVADTVSFPMADDGRITEGFLLGLSEAIAAGFAVRIGDSVRVTSAGALEIIRAAERATELTDLRTKVFQLEGQLRKATAPKQQPLQLGQRMAAGA